MFHPSATQPVLCARTIRLCQNLVSLHSIDVKLREPKQSGSLSYSRTAQDIALHSAHTKQMTFTEGSQAYKQAFKQQHIICIYKP